MGWGDFLQFSELFFQWRNMTYDMRWCGMLLKFSELFVNREGDVAWGDFFELFFNIERWRAWGDVTCYLNFQNYVLMEKCDVTWGDFLKFLELFFKGERWCVA
jgi:hypothetical protein